MSGPSHLPDVDAVVINRDGGDSLFRALTSLERQAGVVLSTVVVDNGSRPGERARLAKEAPGVRVIGFSRNLGFAGAANEGIARTRAPFVLLVNNDAVLEPDYAAQLAARLEHDERVAAVQGLVLSEDGARVDSAGLEWNARGEAVPILSGAPRDRAPKGPFEVSGVCATATLYRRAALESVAPPGEAFEGSFFAYYEDVDLSLRLARAGWRFECVSGRRRPARRVAHGPPHALPARLLDRAQPLAHALSEFRARSARPQPRSAPARGPGPRPPGRLEGTRAAPARLAPGALPRSARPRPAAEARGLARCRGQGALIREITVICVSWKDRDDVLEAVGSLAKARSRVPGGSPRVSLVVVDNGGDLVSAELETLWPGMVLLANPSNRGLGPASNQAAASVESDVLLFVNPDTRAEGEPFTPIARAFASDPALVAAAPRLVEMSGADSAAGPLRLAPPGREDQASFQLRRLPTLSTDARELLLIDHLSPNNPGRRRARYADENRNAGFAVEQAAAAALAVRRAAFERIGGFDESFVPAWYEDVDLCDRLRNEGAIRYLPEARFRHRGGESAARLAYDGFLPIFYRNALRYRRRRYRPWARLAYRALLVSGMILRLLVLPLRPSVPRGRAESARAYLRVLGLALFPNRQSPIGNRQFP